MGQTRSAGLLNVKGKEWPILYYEQVFGNVFERKESECCAVLMKHLRKVKGEQVLIVQMDEQLKTKNISDVSKQLFCCQWKDKFLLEAD